jgi:hypothetical protein
LGAKTLRHHQRKHHALEAVLFGPHGTPSFAVLCFAQKGQPHRAADVKVPRRLALDGVDPRVHWELTHAFVNSKSMGFF